MMNGKITVLQSKKKYINIKELAFTEKIAGILNVEECIHYNVQGMCNLFIHLPPFSICSLH
jgi:hypothetical protein